MVTHLTDYATNILGLIDLTSLNDNDNEAIITDLCKKAKNAFGHVPAICIHSRFIPLARNLLRQISPNTKIATVVNFPHGSADIELTLLETNLALTRGADEVDLVLPYRDFKNGNREICRQMIYIAKKHCADRTLKVILETGELKTLELIKQASELCIDNGADFIKTSTGKVKVNATLQAAEIMLTAIKASNTKCGFKASGGIKTVEQAEAYIDLAAKIMGNDWIKAANFRFGASGLINDVLAHLSGALQKTTH